MSDPGPARYAIPSWFTAFYALCIAGMGVQAVLSLGGVRHLHAWVAVAEIVGAVLLVVSRTRMCGVVILLAVFAVAAVISLHGGYLPLYLVLHAGTAVLIARSGAATVRQQS